MSLSAPEPPEPWKTRVHREWDSLKNNLETEWNDLVSRLEQPHQWNDAIKKESTEITDYYLSADQQERLTGMPRWKRLAYKAAWVFAAIFEKLHPERRVVAIIGMLLIFFNNQSNNNALLGGLMLIVVIMLELKDKLMAHDELEAGRKIQESLMPERMPAVNGWSLWLYTRSANEVCGDLIDFQRFPGGQFSVTIADVAGKGLHAALITAKLQATVRALAGEISSLPALIGKINQIVHRDSPAKIFSSLFYVICSETTGAVAFVNAGHYPALIKRGATIDETPKGEAALGLSPSMMYGERKIQLNKGDLFVLYSDGLTEAKNERGEFFGKERLMEVLQQASGTSERIGAVILSAVHRFVGKETLSDDLSVIVLQRIV